jgi:hypothetical protein
MARANPANIIANVSQYRIGFLWDVLLEAMLISPQTTVIWCYQHGTGLRQTHLVRTPRGLVPFAYPDFRFSPKRSFNQLGSDEVKRLFSARTSHSFHS